VSQCLQESPDQFHQALISVLDSCQLSSTPVHAVTEHPLEPRLLSMPDHYTRMLPLRKQ